MEKSYKQTLADNIVALAEQKGVSKTTACTESGAGRSFISNITTKDQEPSFKSVFGLAQYFGVSIDYLVGYFPTDDTKIEKILKFASTLTEEQVDKLIEHYSAFLPTKQ